MYNKNDTSSFRGLPSAFVLLHSISVIILLCWSYLSCVCVCVHQTMTAHVLRLGRRRLTLTPLLPVKGQHP